MREDAQQPWRSLQTAVLEAASRGEEMNWGHTVGMEDFGGTVELISQGPRRRTEQRDRRRCDQGGWMSRVSTERKNPVVQGCGEQMFGCLSMIAA